MKNKKDTGSKSEKKKKHTQNHLSDLDLHLLGEGNHFKSYEKLGAHIASKGKKKGVRFTVWSPNAKSVSVVGEFNNWREDKHEMKRIDHSAYWSVFVPGLEEGDIYKYALRTKDDKKFYKSDPYAFKAELRPGTASVVESLKKYKWNDKEWIDKRKKFKKGKEPFKREPVSIYEVHAGSWKKNFDNKDHPNEWGYKTYRQLAHELVDYVKEMSFTHIELLPLMEHPLDISWGYQVVNYFAPTSRYGNPEDLMYLVDLCHQNEIGVILDWVPSHFPTDEHGPGNFDGKEIYAYESPKKGFHKEWGTYVFDYGKNEVRNFLISNALFWFEKYHIDGLRVDAVASMLYLDYSRKEGEWEPNIYGGKENLEAVSFLKKLNETVHKKHKGVLMIAEESTAWPGVTHPVHLGGLGFDMKWNMGWMHDTLSYFSMDPVYRKFHHGKLTFSIWYAFSEKFLLPVSHDEVVHLKRALVEKMPGDQWQKFANLRLFFGFMFTHPGKKLNFMGNEFAQHREWNSEASLDWNVLEHEYNKKLNLYFQEINKLYKDESALHEVDFESNGFQWIDFTDSDNSVIAYARYNSDKSEILLITFNMTPVVRKDYVFGVPYHGFYKEIFNSDAAEYGGSGEGNYGGRQSKEEKRYEFPYSISVTLPPLAVNIYKYEKPVIEKKIAEASTVDIVPATYDPDVEIITKGEDTAGAEVQEPETGDAITDVVQTIEVKPELNEEKDQSVKAESPDTEKKSKDEITDEDMEEKIKEIINKIKKF